MTDQRATDDAVDPVGDEITIDPELTTAADAGWLADLRSRAKSTGVSVGELLGADDVADDDDPAGDAVGDDAATIAPDDDTMNVVRAAVAAARPTPTPAPPVTPLAAADPIAAVAIPSSDPGPRWEPPARLTAGREAPIPTLVATESRRSIMPLLAGLGALIIALVVVVIVLVWPGGDDAPVDPTDSVVEIEVDRDAPAGENTE